MDDDDECRNHGGPSDDIEQTQDYQEPYDMTMQAPSPTRLEENPRSNVWGSLRRKGGDQEEVRLEHRTIDGKRDTYVIGRSKGADITVEDKRVSSQHCKVYCDYAEARLRVFVEDSSVNGTFVNDSLTRLHKGKRLELKTGDQIYLINPRSVDLNNGTHDNCTSFLYVNLRDRLLVQRTIGSALEGDANNVSITSSASSNRHVEDFYVIGDQLGSGMCGQVHRCMNRITGEHCAVKIIDTRKFALTPGLSPSELREEAEMMRMLDHPNIMKIKDTYETDHVIFIVMELVNGGDLFDRIVEKGRYTEKAARDVMKSLLSAVSYLHANNIIHRDLKPENILCVSTDSDTNVMLTDFGLAKKANQEGLKTFCGTPQYFAPEVLSRRSTVVGAGRYGTSADMWSLGVVLYILLSGTFPFNDDENLFHQIQTAQYSVSGPEWTNISESAKHLVRSFLTLRPDLRISVQQAILHPWIRGENVMTPVRSKQTDPGSKKSQQKPRGGVSSASRGDSTVKNKIQGTSSSSSSSSSGANSAQLDLIIQSSASRPFGSCSWSHRNSRSQNLSQSLSQGMSQGMSQNLSQGFQVFSPYNVRASASKYDDDRVAGKLDGISLFRMATGVIGGVEPSPSLLSPAPAVVVPSKSTKGRSKTTTTSGSAAVSSAISSQKIPKPEKKRKNTPEKKVRLTPEDNMINIAISSSQQSGTSSSNARGIKKSQSSANQQTAESSGIKGKKSKSSASKSLKITKAINSGISAIDAMELSDDGIEEFDYDANSDAENDITVVARSVGSSGRGGRGGRGDGNRDEMQVDVSQERNISIAHEISLGGLSLSSSSVIGFSLLNSAAPSLVDTLPIPPTHFTHSTPPTAPVAALPRDPTPSSSSSGLPPPHPKRGVSTVRSAQSMTHTMASSALSSKVPHTPVPEEGIGGTGGIGGVGGIGGIEVTSAVRAASSPNEFSRGMKRRSMSPLQSAYNAEAQGLSEGNEGREGNEGKEAREGRGPVELSESPRRKVRAIAVGDSKKPSSAAGKAASKRGVPSPAGGAGGVKGVGGMFKGSLEEAWGRSRTPVDLSSSSSSSSSSSLGVVSKETSPADSTNIAPNSSSGGVDGVDGVSNTAGCLTRSNTVSNSIIAADNNKEHNEEQKNIVSAKKIKSIPVKHIPNNGIAGRRKLRVPMKSLVDIFQPAVSARK